MADESEQELSLHISPLRALAVQIHEMYRELETVGFSKPESLQIVSHIMVAGLYEFYSNDDDDNDEQDEEDDDEQDLFGDDD